MRDTSLDLMDTMPGGDSLRQIRVAALGVPGVLGVEKCFARKTGLQHHVDLHLEVDPNLTVWESHTSLLGAHPVVRPTELDCGCTGPC